ncbi:hypothetical protein BZA70DRAFT_280103 [Myxozyma melibiosi]|uniref:Telomeric single stranded DNA binding POT1/Cdc13 domain-containing protein n=1 Tax=Myxozyma melibiosi TaxID=54550 RepID=A0ABR1F4S5_9ASCO
MSARYNPDVMNFLPRLSEVNNMFVNTHQRMSFTLAGRVEAIQFRQPGNGRDPYASLTISDPWSADDKMTQLQTNTFFRSGLVTSGLDIKVGEFIFIHGLAVQLKKGCYQSHDKQGVKSAKVGFVAVLQGSRLMIWDPRLGNTTPSLETRKKITLALAEYKQSFEPGEKKRSFAEIWEGLGGAMTKEAVGNYKSATAVVPQGTSTRQSDEEIDYSITELTELKDLHASSGRMYTVVGDLLRTFDAGRDKGVVLTDYTENKQFRYYENPGMPSGRYGLSLILKGSAYGQMQVQGISEGDFIRVQGIRPRMTASGGESVLVADAKADCIIDRLDERKNEDLLKNLLRNREALLGSAVSQPTRTEAPSLDAMRADSPTKQGGSTNEEVRTPVRSAKRKALAELDEKSARIRSESASESEVPVTSSRASSVSEKNGDDVFVKGELKSSPPPAQQQPSMSPAIESEATVVGSDAEDIELLTIADLHKRYKEMLETGERYRVRCVVRRAIDPQTGSIVKKENGLSIKLNVVLIDGYGQIMTACHTNSAAQLLGFRLPFDETKVSLVEKRFTELKEETKRCCFRRVIVTVEAMKMDSGKEFYQIVECVRC